MANVTEQSLWEVGVYQIETSDPVIGGANGIANRQALQLANRTLWLKDQVSGLGTGKQPVDATLTALAGLNTSANQLIYATGADQFALTPLTAFIRTLLDDADASAALTTLGAAPLSSPSLTGVPTAPTAAAGTNTTQLATTAFVQNGLNSKLNKSGDVVAGLLKAQYTNDWVGFAADNPTEGKSTFFDGQVAGIVRGGMQIKPAASGNGEYFTTITATPAGATNADRRVGGLDVYAGGLYANAYGWLHDYFLKRSDCITNWYPSHYVGAQTFKIRNLNLMITTMRVDALGADTTLNLPEAYTGIAHVIGSDAWNGKNVVASCMVSGTQIRAFAGPSTSCTFFIIGFKNNI